MHNPHETLAHAVAVITELLSKNLSPEDASIEAGRLIHQHRTTEVAKEDAQDRVRELLPV